MKTGFKKKVSAAVLTALCLTTAVSAMASSDTAGSYADEWSGYVSNPRTSYTDVPSYYWAHDAIVRVGEVGWFRGYPDGSFRPDAQVTREEAMTVFVKFLGLQVTPVISTSYHDVSPTSWSAPYIEAGDGLIPVQKVMGQTPFRPTMPITRADTVYALVKAKGYESETVVADQSVLNMFEDAYSISESIKPYVAVALNHGLVSGFPDGTIRATDPLSRAEFATMLYRASFVGANN